MALAEGQDALVKAVLETSYPDTITWEQENVPAILWTTHAGQETGHAVADVLFGDHNPSGRLTQTWYRSELDLPSILDYDIIASDATYLYSMADPLYSFGYGLSYSTFRYSNIRTSAWSVDDSGTVKVTVRVTNTGDRAGDEVVQLYTRQRTSRDKQPLQQLRTFERVHLGAGESKDVRLTLDVADLAHWDVTRSRSVVERSTYDLMVGASSSDIRQSASIVVRGETIPARDLSQVTRAENFDTYSGVLFVDESKAQGTSVGSTVSGSWVRYADAALGRPRTFTAQVAKSSGSDTTIQVRLDSPTGRLVGTARVASTGDVYTSATVTASLVLGEGTCLATFSMR